MPVCTVERKGNWKWNTTAIALQKFAVKFAEGDARIDHHRISETKAVTGSK